MTRRRRRYCCSMASRRSVTAKVSKARVLARTGRYRSLKALAAKVKCAESTLRRHGVRLPRQPRSGARPPPAPAPGVSTAGAVPGAAVSAAHPGGDDTAVAACDLPAGVGVLPSFEFRPPDQGGDAMPALADGVWRCTNTLRRLETQRDNIKLRGVALTGPSAEQWAAFARAEVSRADTEGIKPGGYWKGDIDAMRDVLAEMAAPQTAVRAAPPSVRTPPRRRKLRCRATPAASRRRRARNLHGHGSGALGLQRRSTRHRRVDAHAAARGLGRCVRPRLGAQGALWRQALQAVPPLPHNDGPGLPRAVVRRVQAAAGLTRPDADAPARREPWLDLSLARAVLHS